jgi:hypothetical protein
MQSPKTLAINLMTKMNQVLNILTVVILTGCRLSHSEQQSMIVADTVTSIIAQFSNDINIVKQDSTSLNNTNESLAQPLSEFQKATMYRLGDTLSADFNGDGFLDKAIFIKDNQTSGIVIMHGSTNSTVRIGFGEQFSHMTDFDWVDYWGLVEDRETSEMTFTAEGDVADSKIVKLENPSIALGKYEVGGGLITCKNGAYRWIHQTC